MLTKTENQVLEGKFGWGEVVSSWDTTKMRQRLRKPLQKTDGSKLVMSVNFYLEQEDWRSLTERKTSSSFNKDNTSPQKRYKTFIINAISLMKFSFMDNPLKYFVLLSLFLTRKKLWKSLLQKNCRVALSNCARTNKSDSIFWNNSTIQAKKVDSKDSSRLEIFS